MKVLYIKGFTPDELASYKTIVYSNVISTMANLIRGAQKLQIELENKSLAESFLESATNTLALDEKVASTIATLWKDPGITKVYEQRSEIQIIDSAAYYFDNLQRIASANYMPSVDDVLRSRSKTTGIIEIEWLMNGVKFKLVDVGGQRSERKKWMHCFQDVNAVIFCVALSEYDLKLEEDDATNRMDESLKLFQEIATSKWFVSTPIILFLNKKDLFEEKIAQKPITLCPSFKSYEGKTDAESVLKYIEKEFVTRASNIGGGETERSVYVKATIATDSKNVDTVFRSVQDHTLQDVLHSVGFQ